MQWLVQRKTFGKHWLYMGIVRCQHSWHTVIVCSASKSWYFIVLCKMGAISTLQKSLGRIDLDVGIRDVHRVSLTGEEPVGSQ